MMNLFRSPEDRDNELLSAYLDNALSPGDRLKVAARLAVDAKLRRTLNELRSVKTGLADLPKVKPPRNFTLTPALAGRPARRPASPLIPALNWATGVAAILFVAVISFDLLRPPNAVAPQTEAQNFTTQAEAPAAEVAPQVALAPEASLKSVTETPADGSQTFADATPEVTELRPQAGDAGNNGLGETEPYGYAGEPLTGGPGVGGGLPEAAGETSLPAQADLATASTETPAQEETVLAQAVMANETPEADDSETTTADTAPAPAENLQVANTQATQPNTLRLAQLVLGLALIGLVTASFVLRRR